MVVRLWEIKYVSKWRVGTLRFVGSTTFYCPHMVSDLYESSLKQQDSMNVAYCDPLKSLTVKSIWNSAECEPV